MPTPCSARRLWHVAPLLLVALPAAGQEAPEGAELRFEIAVTADGCGLPLEVPRITVKPPVERSVHGSAFVRYEIAVANWRDFPDELFRAAPDLPPCGLNTSSSRTWIQIHDAKGRRIYGFCALRGASGLRGIWFSVPRGEQAPEGITVEVWDRLCDRRVRSNVAPLAGMASGGKSGGAPERPGTQ